MIVKTRAVAGAARRVKGTERANLTHAVTENRDGQEGRVLCGRVKLANLLDDPHATDEDAKPTCPVCLDKDPRGGTYETTMRRLAAELAEVKNLLDNAEMRTFAVAQAWDEETDTSLTETQASLAEALSITVACLREQAESLRQVVACCRDIDPETVAREASDGEIRDAIDTGPLFALRKKLDRLA